MKKLISIILSLAILAGCSATGKNTHSEETTVTSVETTVGTTSQTTVTTEMTTVLTTPQKVYEKKSLYDIMLTLPQNPPVGKPATQMAEKEIFSVGNTVANNYKNICYKYFSGHWFEYVKIEPNIDENIDFPYICELDEYSSLDDFAILVNDCMTADTIKKVISENGFYVEINNQIYCNDITHGWPFGSKCYLNSYQIIDDNTMKFIFNVDKDPNAEAHQCSFIAKNIGGWKVSDIDIDTSRTIIYQYVGE